MKDDESQMEMIAQSFASSHLRAMEYFVQETERLEQEYKKSDYEPMPDSPKSSEQLKHEGIHDSLAIYAGISSAAYLDSSINEIYKGHIHMIDDRNPILPEGYVINEEGFLNALEKYHRISDGGFFFEDTLEKYQILLILADREVFDTGKMPHQAIQTIIKFRNYFIHYKTEYYSAYRDTEHIEHNLGSALQGKFELNPCANERLPYFPDHCLSHGFAQWAVENSKEFTKSYHERLGIDPFPTPSTEHISSDSLK